MSLLRKIAGPRGSGRSHVPWRHGPVAPPTPPPAEPAAGPPLAEVERVPITFDGRHFGDLHVPPGTDQELLAQGPEPTRHVPGALSLLATSPEWAKLGADLAALGPHRLAIAARAATVAAGGGRGVSVEEEDRIAQWFGGIVDEAIYRGGLAAAAAIWVVLVGDSHADSFDGRIARCPWIAEVPRPPKGFPFELPEPSEPGEAGSTTPDPNEVTTFLTKLRAAAPCYVHTVIACASDSDLRELREITLADDHALEEFRPWGVELAAEVSASESLEDARAMLTYRHLSNTEACSGFADWAHGFASMVAEHALPPMLRIGAVAWLARVALWPAEDAARTCLRPEGEAPRAELPPEVDTPRSNDQAAQAPHERSLVRNVWLARVALREESAPRGIRDELVAALEALGWKLIDGPKQTSGEWKAMVQRDAASMLATGATEQEVLRYLLKLAEDRAKGGS